MDDERDTSSVNAEKTVFVVPDPSSTIVLKDLQREQTQTMHTIIDQGLSVTITITNMNMPSMANKTYKLILIPIIEHATHPSVSDTPLPALPMVNDPSVKDDRISDGSISLSSVVVVSFHSKKMLTVAICCAFSSLLVGRRDQFIHVQSDGLSPHRLSIVHRRRGLVDIKVM